MMVRRWVSFWAGIFSGSMLNLRVVTDNSYSHLIYVTTMTHAPLNCIFFDSLCFQKDKTIGKKLKKDLRCICGSQCHNNWLGRRKHHNIRPWNESRRPSSFAAMLEPQQLFREKKLPKRTTPLRNPWRRLFLAMVCALQVKSGQNR